MLGRGGFGITYLARDHDLNTDVAIKEFFPFGKAIRGDDMHLLLRSSDDADMFSTQLDRFIEEARALAQFNHPSIVRVRRLIEENDTAYFVMDFVEAGTLGEQIEEHGAMKPEDVSNMVRSLVEGLIVVHDAGMVHRDIKPDNILLPHKSVKGNKKKKVDFGNPILIDFGTARQMNDSRSATNYVSMGFAPLEQYTSRSTPDSRSDIFALASVAYAVLSAEVPADANMRQLDPGCHTLAAERFRGKLPARFLEALDQGMAILPNDRPADIREFRRGLFGDKARTIKVEPADPPHTEAEKPVATPESPPVSRKSNKDTGTAHGTDASPAPASQGSNKSILAVAGLAFAAIIFGGGYALFGGQFGTPQPENVVITATPNTWTPVALNGSGDISIKSDGPFRIRDNDTVYMVTENKSVNLSAIAANELEVKAIGTNRRIEFAWDK